MKLNNIVHTSNLEDLVQNGMLVDMDMNQHCYESISATAKQTLHPLSLKQSKQKLVVKRNHGVNGEETD